MRLPVSLLLILFIAQLCSCNLVTRPQALRMNNTLVHINDSLYDKGREYGALLGEAIKSKDYSRLAPCRVQFEKFIDLSRERVMHMQDVGGSEGLRHCEADLLVIEKRLVSQDFSGFEHLNAESGMGEIAGLYDVVKADSKEEETLLNKFRIIQEAYARKNGFRLSAR